jgi:hypothetical protein
MGLFKWEGYRFKKSMVVHKQWIQDIAGLCYLVSPNDESIFPSTQPYVNTITYLLPYCSDF